MCLSFIARRLAAAERANSAIMRPLVLALVMLPAVARGEPTAREKVQQRIEAQRERTRARAAERKRVHEAKRVARDLELDARETRRFVKLHRR